MINKQKENIVSHTYAHMVSWFDKQLEKKNWWILAISLTNKKPAKMTVIREKCICLVISHRMVSVCNYFMTVSFLLHFIHDQKPHEWVFLSALH